MGTVRLGSVRVKGREMRVHRGLLAGALAGLLASCAGDPQPPADARAAYAEIVAEEDARGEAGLDRVHAHLESDDPAVRRMAVRALGRLEEAEQVGRIEAMFEDPDPGVRIAAAAAVAQSVYGQDPGDALPALAARVGSETDPAVLGALATNLGRLAFGSSAQRAEAGEAIGDIARRVAELGDGVGHAARLGLARGIEAFARGGAVEGSLPAELVDAATALFTTTPMAAGSMAAARVRRLAAAALIHTSQLAPGHAAALFQDEDRGVRRQAMIWATRDGTDAGPMIRAGLRDPEPQVRVEAIRAYGRWIRPGAEGCPGILAAVGDPDPHVAATALDLAAEPCPEGELEVQRQVLASRVRELEEEGDGWRAPARALNAVAGIAPDGAGEEIRRFAEHGNPFVRAWAARAAGRAGEVEVLTGLSADEDPNVREAALQGLGVVAGGGGVDHYLAALASADPQLVMNATRLLLITPPRRHLFPPCSPLSPASPPPGARPNGTSASPSSRGSARWAGFPATTSLRISPISIPSWPSWPPRC